MKLYEFSIVVAAESELEARKMLPKKGQCYDYDLLEEREIPANYEAVDLAHIIAE